MPINPLDILNAVLPKDPASRRIARGVSYGPNPRHKADLFAPRRVAAQRLPVVIFYYGGSWSTGDRGGYEFVGRALAALGYLVVLPDYRLLPEVEYPDFLADCALALKWTAGNAEAYGGMSDRIIVSGHSAGAYNAAMLLFDAGLTVSSLRDAIVGFAGLSGPYDFLPFDGPISQRVFGAVPDAEATQPINHVRADLPPIWLATGGKDGLVLPKNSVNLVAAVTRVGGNAELARYERLGHAGTLLSLAWPLRWRAPVFRDLARFLDRAFAQAGQARSLR